MSRIKLPVVIQDRIPLNLSTDEDPEQSAYVEVRHATNEEESSVSNLAKNTTRVFNNDGSQSVTTNYSGHDMRKLQAYLALTDCNLTVADDDHPEDPDKDKPLFTFRRIDGKMRVDMNPIDFEKAWGKLPTKWADAVTRAVYKVNPQWDPTYRGE